MLEYWVHKCRLGMGQVPQFLVGKYGLLDTTQLRYHQSHKRLHIHSVMNFPLDRRNLHHITLWEKWTLVRNSSRWGSLCTHPQNQHS